MARVQNTLIGKSSGSVGGATFSTWKGINVLKSKAINVANPQTDAQQLQRSRLTIMVGIFRIISFYINVGYKSLAIGKSEYNAFMSDNIQTATAEDTPDSAIFVPANMSISQGTMTPTNDTSVAGVNADANVDVEWNDDSPLMGWEADDIPYAVVYNATQNTWGFASGGTRADEVLTIEMPENSATADVLHSWTFFKRADSEVVSDSAYTTSVV